MVRTSLYEALILINFAVFLTIIRNEMTATQRKVYLGVVVGLAIFLCIFVLSTIAFLNKSSSNTSSGTNYF